MELLPIEILENILINVPTRQISFNKTWICKKITRIILNPLFWLKKLKVKGIYIDAKILAFLQEFTNTEKVHILYYTSLSREWKSSSNITLSDIFLDSRDVCDSDRLELLLFTCGTLICQPQYSSTAPAIGFHYRNLKPKASYLFMNLVALKGLSVIKQACQTDIGHVEQSDRFIDLILKEMFLREPVQVYTNIKEIRLLRTSLVFNHLKCNVFTPIPKNLSDTKLPLHYYKFKNLGIYLLLSSIKQNEDFLQYLDLIKEIYETLSNRVILMQQIREMDYLALNIDYHEIIRLRKLILYWWQK